MHEIEGWLQELKKEHPELKAELRMAGNQFKVAIARRESDKALGLPVAKERTGVEEYTFQLQKHTSLDVGQALSRYLAIFVCRRLRYGE